MLWKFVNVDSTTFLRLCLSCCFFFSSPNRLTYADEHKKGSLFSCKVVYLLFDASRIRQAVTDCKFLFTSKTKKRKKMTFICIHLMMHRISSQVFPRTFKIDCQVENCFFCAKRQRLVLLMNFNESRLKKIEIFQ